MRRRFTWGLLVALVCALALLAAACGDDDDSAGTAADTTAAGGADARAQKAIDAGMAAAAAAGDKVDLPKQNIGFVNIVGAVESAQRAEREFTRAAKVLGWPVNSCDAQGDPTKMARCADSLLDQNVDVLVVLGIEPSLIKAQLNKAKKQNVPVVEFSGQVAPDPLFAGTYYPDETKAGQVLTDYLMEKLNALPDETVPIAVTDYPVQWSTARTDTLRTAVKGQDKVKIEVEATTDAANLVEGTRKQVNDQLTAHPDLKALWFGFDSAGQAAGQAVQAKFPGKTFPDKPMVVTFHADLSTIDLMHAGAIVAVSDVPYDAAGWVALDQIAGFVGRQTPMSPEPQPEYEGMGTVYDYVVVDTDNLPPSGEYRTPENDFPTFFTTKWSNEFSNVTG
jgi:ABC-type sugar transport system substrate-binding protein